MWPGQGLESSKSRAGPCKPSTAIPWAPPMHRVPRPWGLPWSSREGWRGVARAQGGARRALVTLGARGMVGSHVASPGQDSSAELWRMEGGGRGERPLLAEGEWRVETRLLGEGT